MPSLSNLDWLADLGAMPGKYVRSLLNSNFKFIRAEARDSICLDLRSWSSVGIYGNSFLDFFCNTSGRERLRCLLATRINMRKEKGQWEEKFDTKIKPSASESYFISDA